MIVDPLQWTLRPLSLVLLTAVAVPAVAEEVRSITAAEFVDRIQESDPRFEGIASRLDAARAEIESASLWPNPSVAYDREEVFASGEALPENFVRLELPIEVSGRRGKRVDAAEAGERAAAAELGRERFLLTLSAIDLYDDGAALRLRVEMIRERREALFKLLQAVRARTRAGDTSGYDLSRIELELASHDELLGEAGLELTRARRSLAALLGEDGLVDAADPLALPGVPEEEAVLVERALAQRGDYRGVRERGEQADHERSAAARAWVPVLELSGGLKVSDLGNETGVGYTAGVALAVPLFDRGQAERARASAVLRMARAEARSLERSVPLAVKNARDALLLRIDQATRYEKELVPKLDDLVRRAEVSYREGERPVFELLDAYRTAREVRARHLELRREARRSEVDLWRALGRRP